MKAIFKFNNGNGALLCNCCSGIIKTGVEFSEYERDAMIGEKELVPQFCKDCKHIVRMAINMASAYEVRNYLDVFSNKRGLGLSKCKEGLCFYLYNVNHMQVHDIAQHLRVGQSTVYKYIKNYQKLFNEI